MVRRVVEAPPRRAPAHLQAVCVVVESDPEPDGVSERLGEGHERLVRAVAEIVIEGTIQNIESGGSLVLDSDNVDDVAVEEYEQLRKILKTIGVSTAQLPQASLEVVREMIEWRK